MSAYVTLATPMLDEECLVAAIGEQGFDLSRLERSPVAVDLRGWGSGRKAHVVLRREHTGDQYNDIGFVRGDAGYTAILSDDHPKFGRDWLARVSSSYAKMWSAKMARLAAEESRRIEEEQQRVVEAQRKSVHERARKMGYRVQESRVGASIRLVLVKRTY